ncbi:MAG: hypothetical protein LKJ86_06980 [Oscillibacter sp.]|jgi:hypothetical protein|nr:hypothetical protein [Oscillibacter sp.]
MEEKTYVGFNFGRFENDDGKMQDYCNVFMLEDFNGTESNDYHFGGQKAVKYGCLSPDLFKDIQPGTRVQCYFNGKNKVSYMVPVKK